MKKITILLTLTAMLVAGGCIQFASDTVINKDGSGTMTMTYAMSSEVEEAFQELQTMDGGMDEDMGEVPLFDDSFDKAGLEKSLKENGAKLKSYDNYVENGVRTAKIVVEFKNAEGLNAAVLNLAGGSGGMGIFRDGDGNYMLTGVEAPEEEVEEEEAPDMPDTEDMAKAMENAQKSMAVMGKLMAHMNEMEVEMRITFPSDVISHNAHTLEGRTCVWRIDSSNMMSAQGMDEPQVVFSSKGVSIDASEY